MNAPDPMPTPPGPAMPTPPNAGWQDGDRDGSYPQAMQANRMPTPPNAMGVRRHGTMATDGPTGVIPVPNNNPPPMGFSGGKG